MLSEVPRNAQELASIIAFGTRVDGAEGLTTASGSVLDAVFGTARDTSYSVKRVTDDTYAINHHHPIPNFVEVVCTDGTVFPGVAVDKDSCVACPREVNCVRVKSMSRTTAFSRLCVKRELSTLQSMLRSLETDANAIVAQWNLTGKDAFQAVLDTANNTKQLCVDVLMARNAQHVHLARTRNTFVDIVGKVAEVKPCDLCTRVASDISKRRADILSITDAVYAQLVRVHAYFFREIKPTTTTTGVEFVTLFTPPGCASITVGAFTRACEAAKKSTNPYELRDGLYYNFNTPREVLNYCGAVCKVMRLRNIVPQCNETIQGDWNDAHVTSVLCRRFMEPVLTRLLIVVPGLPSDPVIQTALSIDEACKAMALVRADFKRRVKDLCAEVDVNMTVVNDALFGLLTRGLETLARAVHECVSNVDTLYKILDNTVAFDSILAQSTSLNRDIKWTLLKRVEHVTRTRCPIGNVEDIILDGSPFPVLNTSQHGNFAKINDRVYCVHESCVIERARESNVMLPPAGTDFAQWLAEQVEQKRMHDPVEDYLLSLGGCTICSNTNPAQFMVTDDSANVACAKCSTRLHCPPVQREIHGNPECRHPTAGFVTKIEDGSMTCLGCGVVVSEALCIDTGEDERTFAEDDEPSATRHSTAANPFLSVHSDITYIRGGPDVNRGHLKRLTAAKRASDTYAYSDDNMRLTTWVKRDSHVRIFQSILQDAMESKEIKINKHAYETAVDAFHRIRWFQEKLCGIRLVMFTLAIAAMKETRDTASDVAYTPKTCFHCGAQLRKCGLTRHTETCSEFVKKQRVVKRRRQDEFELFTLE